MVLLQLWASKPSELKSKFPFKVYLEFSYSSFPTATLAVEPGTKTMEKYMS